MRHFSRYRTETFTTANQLLRYIARDLGLTNEQSNVIAKALGASLDLYVDHFDALDVCIPYGLSDRAIDPVDRHCCECGAYEEYAEPGPDGKVRCFRHC